MTSAYLNRSPLPLPPLRLQRMTSFFFFNDTATTEIYTLSLHDALPIYDVAAAQHRHLERTAVRRGCVEDALLPRRTAVRDRKSTRLNSSHVRISYAVFCLKKKKKPHHSRDLRAED